MSNKSISRKAKPANPQSHLSSKGPNCIFCRRQVPVRAFGVGTLGICLECAQETVRMLEEYHGVEAAQ